MENEHKIMEKSCICFCSVLVYFVSVGLQNIRRTIIIMMAFMSIVVIIVALVHGLVVLPVKAQSGAWITTGSLSIARAHHIATITKCSQAAEMQLVRLTLQSCMTFQPVLGNLPAGTLNVAHSRPKAELLQNGQVLLAGGATSLCELYNPDTHQ
jgi:hypothetical protein